MASCVLGLVALRNLPPEVIPVAPSRSDIVTFEAVVERLKRGEPYYDAMGAELRPRGYPTSDTFNWRTPLLLPLVAAAPDGVARRVLVAILLTLVAGTAVAVSPRFGARWAIGTGMQAGVLAMFAAPSLVYLGETWAGALIGLSVCAYAANRRRFGFILGMLALFFRELAAPYCVACAVADASGRRWRECGWWALGAVAYAAYFYSHVLEVAIHRTPTDFSHASGWIDLGGLPFLLACFRWTGWLLALPNPFSAAALMCVVAAIADGRTPVHVRLGSLVYAIFFLAAGKPFNHYWGLVAGPTWAIACGYGAVSLFSAIRAEVASLATPVRSA